MAERWNKLVSVARLAAGLITKLEDARAQLKVKPTDPSVRWTSDGIPASEANDWLNILKRRVRSLMCSQVVVLAVQYS